MTTVINIRDRAAVAAAEAAGTYVYCGRPSPWGNPFVIGKRYNLPRPCTRAEAIEFFRTWWYADINRPMRAAAREQLVDKVLGCYCKPLDCHCDVIAADVNAHAGEPV